MLALAILAAVAILVARTVAATACQERLAEQEAVATEQAANVMERLYAVGWQDLSAETAGRIELPKTVRKRLPGARLRVAVQRVGGPVPAKRLSVEIDWLGTAGMRGRPVRLTAWRFAPSEVRP